jgi:hypothetical protein
MFTGPRFDTLIGLYYYRARYCPPKIGGLCEPMEKIWITLIIVANIFVYVRKVMLSRRGYRVAWFVIWGDWSNFIKVIETSESSTNRKLLFAFNISPSVLFIIAILVAILDWMT